MTAPNKETVVAEIARNWCVSCASGRAFKITCPVMETARKKWAKWQRFFPLDGKSAPSCVGFEVVPDTNGHCRDPRQEPLL